MDLKYNEITSGKTLEELLDETINEMAEVVTSTMGPYGRTVILTNRFEGPYTTKDGVSVIKAMGYKDPIKNEIAKLIKEVAEKTLKVAGDGTTTAVCLLHAILQEGRKRLRGGDYLEILQELNDIEKYTIELLEEMSDDLDPNNIYDVATISANGDEAMGRVIEEAFKHSSNVKVEFGIDTYDKVEKINGMVLETGYLDSALVNIQEKDTIRYDNPKVIIIGGKLTDLKLIGNLLQSEQGPWIVIADDVSPNVLSIIRDNYNRGALSIGFMKTPGFGGHRKNLVRDLEMFTGARTVAFNSKTVVHGYLDSIEIGKDKTTITKNKLDVDCAKHVKALRSQLTRLEDGQSKELMEIRISNLAGDMSIIKVGGISTVEVNEKFDRYDDAVKAVSCALSEGIVPGGGQALSFIKERLKEFTRSSFIEILDAPMHKIDKNSNYVLQIAEKDMLEEKVFDPTKVTKTAFINAMSIAKALLNTNNLILDRSLWK